MDGEALLDAARALTVDACVVAGGHHRVAVPRWGGVLGDMAEHWEECSKCPAIRFGLVHTYRHDARIRWGPWRDRHEVAKDGVARTVAGG